jgi:hypothetical protein
VAEFSNIKNLLQVVRSLCRPLRQEVQLLLRKLLAEALAVSQVREFQQVRKQLVVTQAVEGAMASGRPTLLMLLRLAAQSRSPSDLEVLVVPHAPQTV